MCTVSYLPLSDGGYILTSNRDEHLSREIALIPRKYTHAEKSLFYPRDPRAGGTWIATNGEGYTVCLLNGAFNRHISKPPYRHSRGLIVLDFFRHVTIDSFLSEYNFSRLEPFTLIIAGPGPVLNELRWDGETVHHKVVDPLIEHIWSSATLYSPTVMELRTRLFMEWLNNNPKEEVLKFHNYAGEKNPATAIRIKRDNQLQTVSISSVIHTDEESRFDYHDILNNTKYRIRIL
jgi:hypothetical protein